MNSTTMTLMTTNNKLHLNVFFLLKKHNLQKAVFYKKVKNK